MIAAKGSDRCVAVGTHFLSIDTGSSVQTDEHLLCMHDVHPTKLCATHELMTKFFLALVITLRCVIYQSLWLRRGRALNNPNKWPMIVDALPRRMPCGLPSYLGSVWGSSRPPKSYSSMNQSVSGFGGLASSMNTLVEGRRNVHVMA
jgi:hypothetical protein